MTQKMLVSYYKRHRVKTLLSDLKVQNRDINKFLKEFNSMTLKAAKEAIPKGSGKLQIFLVQYTSGVPGNHE